MTLEEAKYLLTHYICCCQYGTSPTSCDDTECVFGLAIKTLLSELEENEPKKGEWHNLIENPNDTPTKTRWYCCKKKSSDDLVMIFGYEEITSLKFDAWIEIYYPL